ncbi:DUF2780 domain-containing protein [Colwellia sp. TT2012]|uniref:DUF2780 domain-containing protein n=1 Tax=Colwellia sp. TT2012 TaxID=1720342 RepID=UPI00070B680C|nr:DUF2780 domain-containing protein [Colwellia sp. TT2012]
MKLPALLISSLFIVQAMPAHANDFTKSLTSQLQKSDTKKVESNALVSYAANQLGMSEDTVTSGLGSLFKVAKDNLSKDNFAMITKAIPSINTYINQAPKSSSSSFTSLLSKSSDTGKAAVGMDYLNSSFKKLGISPDKLPAMLNSVTGYLDKYGYGEASGLLKKGLSFL